MFPTSVENNVLTIHMGDTKYEVKLPFPIGDYQYDNSWFPVSNIMCYLDNGEEIVVMRFDETVTKFTKDYEVIGFSKFKMSSIKEGITTLPVGCEWVGDRDRRQAYQCTVYIVNGTECTLFESTHSEVPILFKTKENPGFVDELMRGTRYFPALVSDGRNHYTEDTGKYELIGIPINVTGYVVI